MLVICREATRISVVPFTVLTSLDLRSCDPLNTGSW